MPLKLNLFSLNVNIKGFVVEYQYGDGKFKPLVVLLENLGNLIRKICPRSSE